MHGWEYQNLGRDRGKSRAKTERLSFFQGKQGQLFQFFPGRIEAHFLHIINPNYSSFNLKCPRKYKKPHNFDIFPTLPQICTSPLPNLLGNPIFNYTPYVYIIDVGLYAKFGGSNVYHSKVIEEKLEGGGGGRGRQDLDCMDMRLRLHCAIYRPDSFVLMLRYCANLKAIRYKSASFNRIVADKSHSEIAA